MGLIGGYDVTPAQLTQLLPAAEDARLERKPEGVNRAEIRQTIVAFANSVGPGEEAVLFIVRPHFAGPAFVRVGAASVAATPAQYEALIASRHQKCGVLQHWNEPITVREQGYRLQTMQVTPGWGATRLCRIEGCNVHNVTIRDLASGAGFTVPMQHVQIAYDHAHNRNQVTVVPG